MTLHLAQPQHLNSAAQHATIADCPLAWSSEMRGGAADAMHGAWQALVCSLALGPLPYGGHVARRSTHQ